MDQLSAHLDRGWDLAQKGDAAGALECARRAMELDDTSPEVHNLLGYSMALSGASEEAIEHYRQAIALDDTYFEAMLNAAEVLLHPLGEWDEALALLDDALELAETRDEEIDCLLLRLDALLGKGEDEAARRTLLRIDPKSIENPAHAFLVGRAHFELGDAGAARPLLEAAIQGDSLNPDAHYYLGLCRDDAGDVPGAIECFLKTRALDAGLAPPPWSPSPEAFAELVKSALLRLDAIMSRYLQRATVYVVDAPGAEIVVDGVDPRALLLIDAGRPGEEAGSDARLFVYQANVERAAGTLEAVVDELHAALEREVTNAFLDREADTTERKHALN